MGIANRKPPVLEMLNVIKYETKKWSTIVHNLHGKMIDVQWERYLYSEMNETEKNWRHYRVDTHRKPATRNADSTGYENELIQQKEELRKCRHRVSELVSEKQCISKEKEYLERRNKELTKKTSELEREISELKSRMQEESGAQKHNSNQELKAQGMQKGQVKPTEADRKVQQLQKQIAEKEDEMQVQKANIESLEMHVKFIEEEKASLLLRLSKMAGDRLVDNNPAIADLSDPNRPTKLGEVYGELYDNEWTTAFEKLHHSGYDENVAVETLQLTLLNVFKFCEMKAGMVLKQATDAVNLLFEEYKQSVTLEVPAHLTIRKKSPRRRESVIGEIMLQQRWKAKNPGTNAEGSEMQQMLRSAGMGQMKERLKSTAETKLIQLRKEVAVSMVPIVQEAYMEASWDRECLEEIKPFIFKCLYLAWMMVVQSPPMLLASCEADEKFDKNMFKEYTRSGAKVDFMVWPALLLEKDGPVVFKGVAQGK